MNQYYSFDAIENAWHEAFASYWSGFIDVFYNKLLTWENLNYLLYGFLVMLLIVFVVKFLFQNKD